MGTTYHFRCRKCGKEFQRNYGIGILGRGTLYCDRCGKARNVDFSCGWDPVESCDCGGSFNADNLGNCPICNNPLTQQDIDPSEPIIHWD